MEGQRSYRYASCLESSLCVELQPRHGARLALHWCFEMNGARPPTMVLCRARTKLIVVRVRTLRSHCPFFCFAAAGRTRWFGSSKRAPLIVANTLAHSAETLSGWICARDTYVRKQLCSTRSAGSTVRVLIFMANTDSECARKAKELLRQRLLSQKGFDIGVLESRRGALRYARGRGASRPSTLTLSGRSWLAKFCCTCTAYHVILCLFYISTVRQLLERTVVNGEGNSLLIIGSQGCGKSWVCNFMSLGVSMHLTLSLPCGMIRFIT